MARKERHSETINVTITGGSTTLPLTSAETIYTNSFPMGDGVDWAVTTSFNAPAVASCNVTTIFEQGFRPPATEGESDAAFVSSSATTISCGPIGTFRHVALTHIETLPYGRFKLSGITTNTGSVVTIMVHKTVEG